MILKAKLMLALGPVNCLRVVVYRLANKWGLRPKLRPLQSHAKPIFFLGCAGLSSAANYVGSTLPNLSDDPPDWHLNPFTKVRADASLPWWKIPDFQPGVGDIKSIWEASRFDWVLMFAQRSRLGDRLALKKLNSWLADWREKNPAYFGANWKCGQEAAIRIMHLAMVALILEQTAKPSQALMELIQIHLKRIAATSNYGLAQNNNHGTSEAAALFIGGSWLLQLGVQEGKAWYRRGRATLEKLLNSLIDEEGSFSQYSVNYHRLVLDTLSMVEVWRRHLGLAAFSKRWQARAAVAADWLRYLVNPHSGDAPNLGANDGARLLPLTPSDYRDYRPSVQLSMALFHEAAAYSKEDNCNLALQWLGLKAPLKKAGPLKSKLLDQAGYALMHRPGIFLLLRYPRFRFRPSQADALHLDVWLKGENLLRDGGTYSYYSEGKEADYFSGVASHNTVQFDNREQMPKISRFLFAHWLQTQRVEEFCETETQTRFGVAYSDHYGACHYRRIQLEDHRLLVEDEVKGFKSAALLRWRLKPDNWRLQDQILTNGSERIKIHASVPILRIELLTGWESRYYLQKTQIPVLEVEIQEPGIISTEIYW